jgi:uncharacterized protein (TIGR02453 family)
VIARVVRDRHGGGGSSDMPNVAAAPTRFEGFADRDGRFFRTLVKNQRREWFAAHRDEYEHGWLRPMHALLAEVRERIDPLLPLHPLAEPKVFRIYRDVRFSKDKSPYKTHVAGVVAIEGGAVIPLYVHLGAGERFAAAGHYIMDAPQLARFRAAVLDERRGTALAATLAALARAGFVVGSYETLKKVPRGVDPDHPRADLLRRKGLTVTFPALPPALLVDRALVAWLVRHVKRVVPLVDWLVSLGDASDAE